MPGPVERPGSRLVGEVSKSCTGPSIYPGESREGRWGSRAVLRRIVRWDRWTWLETIRVVL